MQGYTGPACNQCCRDDSPHPCNGTGYYHLLGECEVCPANSGGILFGVAVVLVIFSPAVYKLAEDMKSVATVNIALAFAQV
eukprot:8463861-Pyramimonas_sp.AAC.2